MAEGCARHALTIARNLHDAAGDRHIEHLERGVELFRFRNLLGEQQAQHVPAAMPLEVVQSLHVSSPVLGVSLIPATGLSRAQLFAETTQTFDELIAWGARP